MCGIVGFTGRHQAAPILLDGLSKLEYRGYDSAGIAVRDGEKDIEIIKAKGRLKVLLEKTNAGESVPGMCGPAGQLMENHQRSMPILMSVITEMWQLCITALSRITRS
jgi:glucosamine 6-phosphate synthetase-like amidotransferase/phosphosugar isomerase protein